jgi:hypothetical protein
VEEQVLQVHARPEVLVEVAVLGAKCLKERAIALLSHIRRVSNNCGGLAFDIRPARISCEAVSDEDLIASIVTFAQGDKLNGAGERKQRVLLDADGPDVRSAPDNCGQQARRACR